MKTEDADNWNIMVSRLYDHPVFHVYGSEKAAIIAADAELKRLREGHCKDCCCARSWEALGVTENTGKSIVEHIEELRASLKAALKGKEGG